MADSSPGKENDDSGSYINYDAKDIQYFGAQGVIEKELGYIRRRRGLPEQHDDSTGKPPKLELAGLALSGGGIRSASFSLGVMQALAHNGWLKNFDYLSTVSGGGYIGSSVSWLLSHPMDPAETGIDRFGLDRKRFPYGSYPMSGSDPERRLATKAGDETRTAGTDGKGGVTERYKGKLLRHLRQQAKYLTPGDGINAMSLVAVILRGALVSLGVYFGLLLALFLAAAYPLLSHTPAALGLPVDAGNLALWLGLLLAGLLVLLSLGYAVFTSAWSKSKRGEESEKSAAYRWRQAYERSASTLLTLTVALFVLGAVPAVYEALQALGETTATEASEFVISGSRSADGTLQFSGTLEAPAVEGNEGGSALPGWIGALSTLFGALSGVFAFFKTSSGKKGRIPMGLVVTVATAALWFGLLLLAYHCAILLLQGNGGAGLITAIVVITAGALSLGRLANINYLSIHRYYRDRLMELFMPDI